MKILIISDTHRKHENLLKVLERECPVDLLIHLGDAEGYEDYIAEQAGCPVEVVAGNNDFFSSLPRDRTLREAAARYSRRTKSFFPVAFRSVFPDFRMRSAAWPQVLQSLISTSPGRFRCENY